MSKEIEAYKRTLLVRRALNNYTSKMNSLLKEAEIHPEKYDLTIIDYYRHEAKTSQQLYNELTEEIAKR